MKKYLFAFLLFSLASSSISASAVVICEVKAVVKKILTKSTTSETDSNVRILVKSVKFTGGHSAGENCMISEDQDFDISVEQDSLSKLIEKQTYTFVYRRVYNINAKGKRIFVSWELKE